MGEESPKPTTTTPTGAVFLSYASQDAEAAQRICAALRSAVEDWLDQNYLCGRDAWDGAIRKTYATFTFRDLETHPSAAEGYLRLEWKLAVNRLHLFMLKTSSAPIAPDRMKEPFHAL